MSQTKNNVAADVIVNANVNTINKLEYNIIGFENNLSSNHE
jgi:hypothetical protein